MRFALDDGLDLRLRFIEPAALDEQFRQPQMRSGQIAAEGGGALQTGQGRAGIFPRPRQATQVGPTRLARLEPFRLRVTKIGLG